MQIEWRFYCTSLDSMTFLTELRWLVRARCFLLHNTSEAIWHPSTISDIYELVMEKGRERGWAAIISNYYLLKSHNNWDLLNWKMPSLALRVHFICWRLNCALEGVKAKHLVSAQKISETSKFITPPESLQFVFSLINQIFWFLLASIFFDYQWKQLLLITRELWRSHKAAQNDFNFFNFTLFTLNLQEFWHVHCKRVKNEANSNLKIEWNFSAFSP